MTGCARASRRRLPCRKFTNDGKRGSLRAWPTRRNRSRRRAEQAPSTEARAGHENFRRRYGLCRLLSWRSLVRRQRLPIRRCVPHCRPWCGPRQTERDGAIRRIVAAQKSSTQTDPSRHAGGWKSYSTWCYSVYGTHRGKASTLCRSISDLETARMIAYFAAVAVGLASL